MKKIILILLLSAAGNVYAQTKTLSSVNIVKPKPGQWAAFEDSWKAHLGKYHVKDTTNKRYVYEVQSGVRSGYYYLVEADISYADLDIERTTDKAHDLDFLNTVTNKLDIDNGPEYYRFVDSLSYRPEVQASKYLFTFYQLKTGKQSELVNEISRAVAVNKKNNAPTSVSIFVKQLAGGAPVVVQISNLKDGYKQLETNYFPGNNDKFKSTYIQMYGQDT